jgi:hypothetical protein
MSTVIYSESIKNASTIAPSEVYRMPIPKSSKDYYRTFNACDIFLRGATDVEISFDLDPKRTIQSIGRGGGIIVEKSDGYDFQELFIKNIGTTVTIAVDEVLVIIKKVL